MSTSVQKVKHTKIIHWNLLEKFENYINAFRHVETDTHIYNHIYHKCSLMLKLVGNYAEREKTGESEIQRARERATVLNSYKFLFSLVLFTLYVLKWNDSIHTTSRCFLFYKHVCVWTFLLHFSVQPYPNNVAAIL